MEEDTRINKLNKKIIRNEKRIKNLRIRDDIIGYIPMFVLSGSVTAVCFKYHDNTLVSDLYPISFFFSLIIGGIPSVYLPTKKTQDKIERYNMEINMALDELHGYAIEEDKKRMIKKS